MQPLYNALFKVFYKRVIKICVFNIYFITQRKMNKKTTSRSFSSKIITKIRLTLIGSILD